MQPNNQPAVPPQPSPPNGPIPPASVQPPVQDQATQPAAGPIVQQPLAPQQAQLPVQDQSFLQPKKSRRWLWVVFALLAIALLIGGGIFLSSKLRGNGEFAGNYQSLKPYNSSGESETKATYSFLYPATMSQVQKDNTTVVFEKKAKTDKKNASAKGWESKEGFYISPTSSQAISGLKGDNELLSKESYADLVAKVFQKALETNENGYTDVAVNLSAGGSNYVQGKVVLDYSYKDKSQTVIKGRRIQYYLDSGTYSLDISAVEKLWDGEAGQWNRITESFEVD